MELKLWEREWLDISFKKAGLSPSYLNLPTKNFYDNFYRKLFEKYSSWEQLPKSWLDEKKLISYEIMKLLPENSKVLSFGTGLGYIEKNILENRKDIELECFDISNLPSKWLLKNYKNLKYETNLEKLGNYDFIYFSQVLYAMPKKLILNIFKKIYKLINTNGKILLIDTPPRSKSKSFLIIRYSKILYNFLFKYNQYQFWGWLRDSKTIKEYLNNCGLVFLSKNFIKNQEFQLYSKR